MGHKVSPIAFRIPHVKKWTSSWFSKRFFAQNLENDVKIRDFLKKRFKKAEIDQINIERTMDDIKIIIYTAKPGLIIGKKGQDIANLRQVVIKRFLNNKTKLEIEIKEVSQPLLSAQIVLSKIIIDLEKRVRYRRAMKRMLEQIKQAGAKGAKIKLAGRLNGVEIARKETLAWGRMPLQTIRSDINYAQGEAHTIYGSIGIKIWIYRGDIFTHSSKEVINSNSNKKK